MRATVAFLLNFHLALYFAAGQAADQKSFGVGASSRLVANSYARNSFSRHRRDLSKIHVVDSDTECVKTTAEDGHFFYKSRDDEEKVCGIYLVAEPNKRIEVIVTSLNVPCENNGLVAWLDGWELNGQLFPPSQDHPRSEDDRAVEMCGAANLKRVLVSSQNAALIQYRITQKNRGFSVLVRHIDNPTPCNVLVTETPLTYTLRNYGKAKNCSLTTIAPATVQIVSLDVGVTSNQAKRILIETGIVKQCKKRGLPDFVEIGGSAGLDYTNMHKYAEICGMDSMPALYPAQILCEVTTVRLRSGGQFLNSVTVTIDQFDLETGVPNESALICPLEAEV